ncbi:MAG: Mg2+/Co2+ transporter [Rhodospirillaceae bacterium]|nr:MAG: Mg2+/Co2+ transporter [Rhodospirillaceae bacterium]
MPNHFTPIDNSRGLICGYVLHPDRALEPLPDADIDDAMASPDHHIWLHFNLADMRARRWLEHCTIPRAARDALLGNREQMLLEPAGSGLVGILGDLHHDFQDDSSKLGVLRLYLDDRCLISARRHPLKAIDSLRRSLDETGSACRPVGLVTRFLHHLAETMGLTITDTGQILDRIEDRILAGYLTDEGTHLGRARQLIIRLRRHMVPQRQALFGLLGPLPDWLTELEAAGLRQAVERLDMLGHDLDLLQDRARLLQDEIANKQAERTNHNLYVLSIVTTIFLPLTLITGVFGMNVGGLPGLQNIEGFWWVMLGMAITAVCSLILLYWKKLF